MNSILKNMARVSLFLAISVGAMANLDEGRWVPKNREVLDKVISENKNQGNLISMITSDIELLEVFYAHTISPVLIASITSIFLFLYFFQRHLLK